MKQEEHRANQPRHRLATTLRDAITSGQFAPGAQLPSERALAGQHNVARNTARDAITDLAAEGLVTVQHGRGAFVREPRRLMRFGTERYSRRLREETGVSPFRAEVSRQGRTASVDCRSIERAFPPPDVAQRLNVRADHKSVVRRENWYYADDEPVQVGVTFIPWHIAKGGPLGRSSDLGPGSLYARLAERGHELKTIREEVTARVPTRDEIQGLLIPDGVPVLDVLHTSIDENETPFEVTKFTLRADLNGLDYRIAIEE